MNIGTQCLKTGNDGLPSRGSKLPNGLRYGGGLSLVSSKGLEGGGGLSNGKSYPRWIKAEIDEISSKNSLTDSEDSGDEFRDVNIQTGPLGGLSIADTVTGMVTPVHLGNNNTLLDLQGKPIGTIGDQESFTLSSLSPAFSQHLRENRAASSVLEGLSLLNEFGTEEANEFAEGLDDKAEENVKKAIAAESESQAKPKPKLKRHEQSDGRMKLRAKPSGTRDSRGKFMKKGTGK